MQDTLTDAEIIKSTLNGETEIFAEIIKRYKDIVYNFVYRLTNSIHDTEDILQDTFILALKNLKSFNFDYSFRNWIITIALNTAKNKLKRRNIVKFFSLDKTIKVEDSEVSWQIPDNSITPEEHLLKKEESQKINDLISKLPVKYRDVIVLRMVEGMSYDEIAKTLDIPLGTVETRIHRAKEVLIKLHKKCPDSQTP